MQKLHGFLRQIQPEAEKSCGKEWKMHSSECAMCIPNMSAEVQRSLLMLNEKFLFIFVKPLEMHAIYGHIQTPSFFAFVSFCLACFAPFHLGSKFYAFFVLACGTSVRFSL